VRLDKHGRIKIFLETLKTAGKLADKRLVNRVLRSDATRLPDIRIDILAVNGGSDSGATAREDVVLRGDGILVCVLHSATFGHIDHEFELLYYQFRTQKPIVRMKYSKKHPANERKK
jgi:hypothetical protein